MSSLTLGCLFLQVGYQGSRVMMVTALPVRFLAAAVFGLHGGAWRNVAVYEGVWGLVSLGALMW